MMNSEEYTRFYHDMAKDPTFAHTYRTGFNGDIMHIQLNITTKDYWQTQVGKMKS